MKLIRRFAYLLIMLACVQVITLGHSMAAAVVYGSLVFSLNTFLLLLTNHINVFHEPRFFQRRLTVILAILLKIINLLALVYVGVRFFKFVPLFIVLGALASLIFCTMLLVLSNQQKKVLINSK